MGAKGQIIRAELLNNLCSCPGQTTCDLCRQLNGVDPKDITFCNRFSCYANARKRSKFEIKKCSCPYSLQLIMYHLVKLISQGLLSAIKELRTDNYQNRGYDLYTCYYLA